MDSKQMEMHMKMMLRGVQNQPWSEWIRKNEENGQKDKDSLPYSKKCFGYNDSRGTKR
jgi:hypothetical protein